jgi:hypothetical protein
MEGVPRIQDRVVRSASGRVGWTPVSGLRRSVGCSQVLLDVPGFRIPGATRDSRRRCSPGRTRSHRLARRAETQLTSEKITSDRPQCVREPACVLACVWCFFSTPWRVTWSIEGGDEFGYENVITIHFASVERRPRPNSGM